MKIPNCIWSALFVFGLAASGCSDRQTAINAFKLPTDQNERVALRAFADQTVKDDDQRGFCRASRDEIEAKITLIGDKAGWSQEGLDAIREMERARLYSARDTHAPFPEVVPENLLTDSQKGAAIRALESYDQFWASAVFRYPDVWKSVPKENYPVSSFYFSRFQCEEQNKVLVVLKQILKNSVFPADDDFGKGTVRSLFYITQHADDDVAFQSDMLAKFQSNEGAIRPSSLAMLTDRVRVNGDALQVYGTQLLCRDGEYIPRPVEDPNGLDERRMSVGLEPFAEYAKSVPGCGN